MVKTIVTKKVLEEETSTRYCDLCGQEAYLQEGEEQVWRSKTSPITYLHTAVYSYSKCFDRMLGSEYYDVCYDCFSSKLVPWLESQKIANEEHSQKKKIKPTV